MKGCVYRWGVRVKDFGERLRKVPVVGFFFAAHVKSLGLYIRNRA
jgi:hypothetical protein